ncbi:hypothetical protein [Desulfosporosinus sp. OT]|uniref:hypothetical protein n=1 Tax=Desulfosporosinus sp. OT TaxID=913865 RepID=UPI000223AD7F|nr:hypothetical protein [Desulfosporosinus sp. OT]EGW39681.1 hypothetical protein DOT_2417 [Desulfosporosinus sp. OT]
MENSNELTDHEKLKLHEILCNETLGVKKIESVTSMVKDQELASFIQSTLATRRQKLQEMQQVSGSSTLQ